VYIAGGDVLQDLRLKRSQPLSCNRTVFGRLRDDGGRRARGEAWEHRSCFVMVAFSNSRHATCDSESCTGKCGYVVLGGGVRVSTPQPLAPNPPTSYVVLGGVRVLTPQPLAPNPPTSRLHIFLCYRSFTCLFLPAVRGQQESRSHVIDWWQR
jgi:hypothetical protein